MTTIRIGPRMKTSVGFLAMAGELRGRDMGRGVVVVRSEVSAAMAEAWARVTEELEEAVGRRPEGGRLYKELDTLLKVGLGTTLVWRNLGWDES